MEFSKKPTSLARLVEVFGWTKATTFVQQDIQEFCCLLIDKLEHIFNQPNQENIITNLFNGQTESLIECRNIDYKSGRTENFIDIQLSLKSGNTELNSLQESLEDFLRKEPLDGENQYDTEKFGKQDADKRVRFKKLPKVLMFHMRRCEYDYMLEVNRKIKHRFEYPEEIDMNQFKDDELKSDESHNYKLFGIFIHHGNDGLAGHYTVFLKDNDGWTEFDDEHAKKTDWEYVKNNSYGGSTSDFYIDKDLSLQEQKQNSLLHAYMLIYIEEKSFENIINTDSSKEKINIQQSLKKLCQDMKYTQQNKIPDFLNKCLVDKSIHPLLETFKHSNIHDLLKNIKNIHLISPIQVLGEPCGLGPFVGIDYQNENKMAQNKRILMFLKQINQEKLKEYLVQPIQEFNFEQKFIEDDDQIQNLLKNTPHYLNIYPGKCENVLLNNLHLIPSGIITELKDSFISIKHLFGPSLKSQLEINFFISEQLSLFSFKKHLLSIMLSSSYKNLFGLNLTEIDENLYLDKKNKNYIDFNLISHDNLDKLFSLYNFFLIDFENSNPLQLLDLDYETKFLPSVIFDQEVFIVPLPKKCNSIDLNSLLHVNLQNKIDFLNIKEVSSKMFSSIHESQFLKYNPNQMFTTNVLTPLIQNLESLEFNTNLESKYSDKICLNENINYLLSLVDQPAFEDYFQNISILIKIFNPSLDVFVSFSFMTLSNTTKNVEFYNLVRSQIKLQNFFMLVEKIDDFFHNAPSLKLVPPIEDMSAHSYWPQMKEYLSHSLNISIYKADKQIFSDLQNTSVHNVYIIPAIESLYPSLTLPLKTSINNSSQNNETSQINNENQSIQRINSDIENSTIITNPISELEFCCFFFDFSFILMAYDLFNKFNHLILINIQDRENHCKRSFFFKDNFSEEKLQTLLFYKFYQENIFYKEILKNERYINGHFFYGNSEIKTLNYNVDLKNSKNIINSSMILDSIKSNPNKYFYGLKRKKNG